MHRSKLGMVMAVAGLLVGCARPLYTFPNLPKALPAGETNLLSDPGFETPVAICTFNCNASSGWSIEHSTPGPPLYGRTTLGVASGSYAEYLTYNGQVGDNGVHKDIELYHGAVGPDTTAGYDLTFTLWVSGHCVKCAPFIGIEAFDTKNHYLGESDQYFKPDGDPRPVQVSFRLPPTTVVAAAYIQVPELYAISKVQLYVDDSSLTAVPDTP
jgi:hypothetical protein